MSKQVMQRALEAFEAIELYSDDLQIRKIATEAIAELENALVAPPAENAPCRYPVCVKSQPLTDLEIERVADKCWDGPGMAARFDHMQFARAVIAAANN